MPQSDPRPDRRRSPWRDDLAADTLRGIVTAPRYVAGVMRQVIRAAAPVRSAPRDEAALETEALFGELITVYEVLNGWAWGQLVRDRYVGYLPATALAVTPTPATHRVHVPATLVFSVADIKSPPTLSLSLNCEIASADAGPKLSRLTSGGFIASAHIALISQKTADFTAVAERFLDTPYLWGGKTRYGLDCSGLVQVALQAAGIAAPRDSDMQAGDLGETVTVGDDLNGLQRGDLVCWKGHIGLMRDAMTLLHANAFHMAVASEPLVDAVARIGALPSFRRLQMTS